MDFKRTFELHGVPFVEIGPWRTHVRPGTFKPEGVLMHHTASSGYDGTLKVVRYGREDLAGPLCNIFIARGKAHIISAGRANHAGTGAAQALKTLRAGRAPAGSAKELGYKDDPGTVGNGLLVGFEILSPGDGTMLSGKDWDVAVRAATAILKDLGHRDVDRIIGHAEWTSRKIDPVLGHGRTAHLNMNAMRKYALDKHYI